MAAGTGSSTCQPWLSPVLRRKVLSHREYKNGFGDESSYQNVTVLTGVEVSRAYGFADQVLLGMVKHRSLSHRSV